LINSFSEFWIFFGFFKSFDEVFVIALENIENLGFIAQLFFSKLINRCTTTFQKNIFDYFIAVIHDFSLKKIKRLS
jgi:hypothetical protein